MLLLHFRCCCRCVCVSTGIHECTRVEDCLCVCVQVCGCVRACEQKTLCVCVCVCVCVQKTMYVRECVCRKLQIIKGSSLPKTCFIILTDTTI